MLQSKANADVLDGSDQRRMQKCSLEQHGQWLGAHARVVQSVDERSGLSLLAFALARCPRSLVAWCK